MQPITSIPLPSLRMTLSTSPLVFLLPPSSSPLSISHSPFPSPLLSMASSHSLQSLHPHNHHHAAATSPTATATRRRRNSIDISCPPSLPSCLFLKSTKTTTTTTTTTTFSLPSTAAAAATSNPPTTFDLLEQHLAAQNFRQADEETRRLLIQLAGEAAQKRGYVFFSEVQFISKQDLKAIDALWRQHSNNRYGYSVQRKIWKKLNKDFTKFFIKLGWMKRLESCEIEQYNYKAFPDEFFWEMTDDTPEGHLPLTNALRGTQLFTSILTHPAFEELEEEEEAQGYNGTFTSTGSQDNKEGGKEDRPPLSKRLFKPNYSF